MKSRAISAVECVFQFVHFDVDVVDAADCAFSAVRQDADDQTGVCAAVPHFGSGQLKNVVLVQVTTANVGPDVNVVTQGQKCFT